MTQTYTIFAIIELLAFCIILYLIIRANIFINTLQKEVNELYFYLPPAIRDVKYDLKQFNEYLTGRINKSALSQQEIGFLAGRIFADIFLSRFSMNPFKKKMLFASVFLKLWNLRRRLKATFMKLFLG